MAGARRSRAAIAALVVTALLLGGAAGYLLASFTVRSGPPPAAVAPPAPPPPPPVAASPTPCGDAAQRGTQLLAALDRAVRAIADLDPGALRAVVDEVEQLRDAMRAEVEACRERGDAAVGPQGSGTR